MSESSPLTVSKSNAWEQAPTATTQEQAELSRRLHRIVALLKGHDQG